MIDVSKAVPTGKTIDIEPDWRDLWRLVCDGALSPEHLKVPCEIAALVRKAQKSGVKITFSPDGSVYEETA